MIYQTDKRLRLEARDDECYLFCVLNIFERVTGHTFTVDQIDKIHRVLVKLNYIRIDGWINENGIKGIAQIASGITGKHAFITLVDACEPYTHVLARFTRRTSNNKLVTHFVEMFLDEQTKVRWDPYDKAGSKTVRIGKIAGYRYIYAEAI